MKHPLALTLFVFAFSILSAPLGAQTLSFSQAKLVTQTETVPAGKVWKVVSVLSNNNLSGNSSSYVVSNVAIAVNGQNTIIKSRMAMRESDMAAADGMTVTDLPLWLPAGTSLGLNTNATGISVLEFTVNP